MDLSLNTGPLALQLGESSTGCHVYLNFIFISLFFFCLLLPFFSFFIFLSFLGLRPRHTEVPRLGVESEL